MDLELTGKVALITGGSEGIGKAAAIELAREGAHVAICARRADVLAAAVEEARNEGRGKVLHQVADVTSAEDIHGFVKAAHDAFGRIDILVNNAGTSAAAPFEKVTDEGWESDLDLKLMGAVRMSRACIPHMREAGGGRIINITAVGGKAPGPGSLPTTVSRAAGIALTKAMSKDLAKDGILVNAICIGLVKSGQISRAAAARFPGGSLDEAFAQMGKNVPIGRIGEAREVAVLIALLASPLGGFISGTAINVDGGMGAAV
jgi:NAD(P)-dependent dehydrogenase (short-subunit alcohol dehydrogenase family)